jgi:hypothetical protein
MKIFGYYPATIIAAITAVLAVLSNLPQSPLTGEQAAWFVTVLSALATAAEAWTVRPRTVSTVVGAVRTTIAAVVLFGLPISDALSGSIVAAVAMIFGLLTHAVGTPAIEPDLRTIQHETDGSMLVRPLS